jgi:hypothetical protein
MGKKLDDLRKRVKRLEKRLEAIDGASKGKSAKKSPKSKSSSSKAITIKKGGTRIKDTPAPVAPVG